MAKKRRTRLGPEFWERDAEAKRLLAERIAYHERKLGEGKGRRAKPELDAQ